MKTVGVGASGPSRLAAAVLAAAALIGCGDEPSASVDDVAVDAGVAAPGLDSVEVSGGGTLGDIDGALPQGFEECVQEWFQELASQQGAMTDQDDDVIAFEHRSDFVEVPGGGIVGEVSIFGELTEEVPQEVDECLQEWALQVSQEDATEQEGTTEWEYSSPPDIYPEVDPVAVALGFTTNDEARALYSLAASARAEVQSAEALHPELRDLLNGTIAGSDVPDEARASVNDSAFRVVAAARALELAVEALYEGLSTTEESLALLNEWRRCMADSGHIYDHPFQMETELMERRSLTDDIPDLLEARDQCLAAVDYAGSSDRAVLQVIPEWKSEHSALLSEYREALDVYERGLRASE